MEAPDYKKYLEELLHPAKTFDGRVCTTHATIVLLKLQKEWQELYLATLNDSVEKGRKLDRVYDALLK